MRIPTRYVLPLSILTGFDNVTVEENGSSKVLSNFSRVTSVPSTYMIASAFVGNSVNRYGLSKMNELTLVIYSPT